MISEFSREKARDIESAVYYHGLPYLTYWVRPKQSDRIPANKILKHFALIEEFCMLIQISKKFVLTWTVQLTFVGIGSGNGPLTRYEKLRVAHAPGMPGTFSPPQRVSDPDIPTFSAHAQPAILRISGKRSMAWRRKYRHKPLSEPTWMITQFTFAGMRHHGPVSISDKLMRRILARPQKNLEGARSGLKCSNRFEIWRGTYQTSKWSGNSRYKSRGFETLRDLAMRRLIPDIETRHWPQFVQHTEECTKWPKIFKHFNMCFLITNTMYSRLPL